MIGGGPVPGMGPSSESGPPGGTAASSPATLPDRIEVESPRKVAIVRADGERMVGPWSGFDLLGVQGPDGLVAWIEIAAPDRLRVGRTLIRAAPPASSASPGAWALLAAALDLSGASDMGDRARAALGRLVPDDVDRWIAAIESVVQETEARRRDAAAAEAAVAIRTTRPHLEPPTGGSAIPARRAGRTPVDVERDRAALRTLVDAEVEGLGLETVPTAQVLATGSGTLEEVAAMGVAVDRCLATARRRLGTAPETPMPAGGLAIVDPGDDDAARVLLARHLVDWPPDEPSLLLPGPRGWLAVLAEPTADRVRAWAAEVHHGQAPGVLPVEAPTVLRQVELARIAARVAMLEAGAGRVPGWIVEGFAEAAAQAMVEIAPLERLGRGPAVAAIRGGLHPEWIRSLDPGDERWGAGGDARRTSHLLVTRLLESGDAVLPGIVQDLANGADPDAAFRRWTGLSVAGWLDDAADWFRTND